MLDSLLTLLIPSWVTPSELDFHIQFVHQSYKTYFDNLAATGLRDSRALRHLKNRTAYSMNILLWYRPLMFVSYVLFHGQLRKLKNLLPPRAVLKLLKLPY